MTPPPRPRKSGRRGWPENLYADRQRNKVYYRYKHPVTGKFFGLGSDFQRAVAAARKLNARLIEVDNSAEALASKIASGGKTAAEFLTDYANDALPQSTTKRGKPFSDVTIKEYRRMLKDAAKAFGQKPITEVRRRDIAQHLEQYKKVSSNRRRALLNTVFKKAVSSGYLENNPVEGTEPNIEAPKRQRLTLAQFLEIRKAAAPWFQNALDLAYYTLQRREDLVMMRFSDIEDDHLFVRQIKLKGHIAGNLRIKLSPELKEVIARCRDDTDSPFLIHKEPFKVRQEYLAMKEHASQVKPEALTREFQRLRDEHGVCDELRPEQRPSFHEIRALGAHRCQQNGWNQDAIQQLLGHASSGTTKKYLGRHDDTVYIQTEALSDALP